MENNLKRADQTGLARETVQRVRQHALAIRAFHTGLVSETHRHLHVLRAFDRHIQALSRHVFSGEPY